MRETHVQRNIDLGESAREVVQRTAEPDRLEAGQRELVAAASRSRFAYPPRFEMIWIAGLFIALTVLAFLFPPNGDDWAWGSRIGISRLDRFFVGYNGRYVANLVVIVLTRSPILAALVVGATLTATIHLVLALTKNRTPWGYAVVTALLLAMPHSLWAQAISWLSGFVNYGLGTLWVLVFMRAVQLDWRRGGAGSIGVVRRSGLAVFAFAAALFMENITIFFVVAAIGVALAQRRSFGRVSASAWCWLIGFVAGALMMFSNSAYRRAATGDQGYQKVTWLHGIVSKALGPISRLSVVDNLAVSIALVALIVMLTVAAVHRGAALSSWIPVVLAGAFLVIVVPLAHADQAGGVAASVQRLGGLAAIVLIAFVLAAGAYLVESATTRTTLFCIVLSAVLLLGPLLVVSPIGPRCFFVSYVMLLAVVSLLMREAAAQLGQTSVSTIGALGSVLTVGLFASLFAVYIPMAHAANERVAFIRQQVADGAARVVVDRLPDPSYSHIPDPVNGLWEKRYKLYYGLPSDLTIKLAPRR